MTKKQIKQNSSPIALGTLQLRFERTGTIQSRTLLALRNAEEAHSRAKV